MKTFTSNAQKIGELGEEVACKYLNNRGFDIVERNYTKKWGEIDIIARKDETLCFIEVKARQVESGFFEDNIEFFKSTEIRPEDNMHAWKMKRLRRVVETYLISKRLGNVDWQFNLLLVYLDTKNRKARVRVVNNIIL